MTDHLPECRARYVADLCTTDIDPVLQEPTCNHCVGQGCICICNRLRACEQRVRQEIDRKAFVWDEGDPYREAYRAGYSKGVRDAHESASWCQDPDEMLQAIIGLLNMPPPPPLPPSVGVPEKWRP